MPNIIIAIDGYSSTGKSSFARLIASKLGFIYLDSGALYRAVTLFSMRNNLIDDRNRIDEQGLLRLLPSLKLSFVLSGDGLRSETYIDDENVEELIRRMDVSSHVSPISAIPFVRNYVNQVLREYGNKGGIVMDGRDIGTKVFPNAQLKIFMTADLKVRAQRRYDQMIAQNKQADLNVIMKNLQDRDFIDSTRAVDPLCKANDAIVLDNTNMTMGDQMVWLNKILIDKWSVKLI